MKRRTISTLAALSLAIPFGTYAIASQAQTNSTVSEKDTTIITQRSSEASPRRGRKVRGRGIERMMEQLDLTAEQTEQIQAIQEQSRSEYESFKEEMKANREKMQSLLASNASSNELRQQHQQIQLLRQQLSDRKFETMLEMREVLTPEQRAKMAQLIKERFDYRSSHRFH